MSHCAECLYSYLSHRMYWKSISEAEISSVVSESEVGTEV